MGIAPLTVRRLDPPSPVFTVLPSAFWSGTALALLLVTGLIASPRARGQNRAGTPLTLQEAERLFVQRSPQWRALRATTAQQTHAARVPALWPNPSVNVEQERGIADAQHTYLLEQPLPNPWVYDAQREITSATIRETRASYREEAAALLFDLRTRYLDAVTARIRLAVFDSLARVIQRVVDAGQARFEEGAINRFDMQRLRLAAATHTNQRADARTRYRIARARLARLLQPEKTTGSLDSTYAIVDTLVYQPVQESYATLRARAMRQRGRLDSARAAVAAGRSALRRERAARVPGVNLVGGLLREPGPGASATQGPVFGLSLKLPLFHQNGTQVAAARAQCTATQARLAGTRRAVAQDVQSAYERLRSLERRIERLDVLQPDSVRSFLDDAVYLYSEGQVSLVELLDAVGAARDTRLLRVDLLSRHRRARFALTRAIGTLPPNLVRP